MLISALRCGAHTLQLAVYDALLKENNDSRKLVMKVKSIVKKLRTPKNMKKFRFAKLPCPILNNNTR